MIPMVINMINNLTQALEKKFLSLICERLRYSRLDIKQNSKNIEKTVLLIKKPVENVLLKLLKLNKSVLPVKYNKVPNEADKNPIIDKNK